MSDGSGYDCVCGHHRDQHYEEMFSCSAVIEAPDGTEMACQCERFEEDK